MTHRLPLLAVLASAFAFAACSSEVDTAPLGCEDFLDEVGVSSSNGGPGEAPNTRVDIVIVNDGNLPIFLTGTGCKSSIDLGIADEEGNPLAWETDSCTATCAMQMDGPVACDASCALPPIVYVEPGGSYRVTWPGTYLTQRQMPAGCVEGAGTTSEEEVTCPQNIAAPNGVYEASTMVYDLVEGCEFGECACEPDADGSCLIQGWEVTPTNSRTASATIQHPSSGAVEIHVDAIN